MPHLQDAARKPLRPGAKPRGSIWAAGDQDLIVKVRASGAAGPADPADLVALVHDATGAEFGRIAVEMGVGGLDRAAVVDAKIVAVGAEPSGGDHHAIACGTNRGAARRCPVDTLVALPPFREGVDNGCRSPR